MVRITVNFAVAAVIMTQLHDNEPEDIRFTIKDVVKIGGKLEQETGIAILNGFTPNNVTAFLDTRNWLAPCNATQYRINFVHENFRTAVMQLLDPPRNYPIKILKAAGILDQPENTATERSSTIMPDENKKKQYRRVCITRSGYAIVPGDTDEEALENATKLSQSDFDWESVDADMIREGEIVEICEPDGTVSEKFGGVL